MIFSRYILVIFPRLWCVIVNSTITKVLFHIAIDRKYGVFELNNQPVDEGVVLIYVSLQVIFSYI